MVIAKVTAAGQLSLPATIRRRWGTSRVAIADEGHRIVVRPVPDDPIKAACGSLVARGDRPETVRARERRHAASAERRRLRACAPFWMPYAAAARLTRSAPPRGPRCFASGLV
jgi:bifunctional DNA-binding transcriptional regulator/antitoxin component of YhaV-PrlF toxin-antitoxin module